MDYSTYVRIATQFLNEKYGGVEVLKKINASVEKELHIYMHKFVMAEYVNDPQKGIKENQKYESKFISSLRS